MRIAEEGINELKDHVDSLIIIPNEKLMQVMGKNCSLINAFNSANDVLSNAVRGIADLITRPGMINVDFADVRAVMASMGMAMMGTGSATGDDRAIVATEAAIKSPLLEDVDLKGASGILVNITAGLDLSLGEFTEVGQIVEEYASENATVVVGTVIDPDMTDELRVTVVATGLVTNAAEDVKLETQQVKVAASGGSSSRAAVTGGYSQHQMDLPVKNKTRDHNGRTHLQEPVEVAPEPVQQPMKKTGTGDLDFLDIPAFLRRQAD
jgi:cell division protein FtsZ